MYRETAKRNKPGHGQASVFQRLQQHLSFHMEGSLTHMFGAQTPGTVDDSLLRSIMED